MKNTELAVIPTPRSVYGEGQNITLESKIFCDAEELSPAAESFKK